MRERVNVTVCTRCLNATRENPSSIPIAGLITCYFCGEQVITGWLESYERTAFETPDDDFILLVTKIDEGLFFHRIENQEIVSIYRMHKDDYSEMLKDRGNLYLQLLEQGFLE